MTVSVRGEVTSSSGGIVPGGPTIWLRSAAPAESARPSGESRAWSLVSRVTRMAAAAYGAAAARSGSARVARGPHPNARSRDCSSRSRGAPECHCLGPTRADRCVDPPPPGRCVPRDGRGPSGGPPRRGFDVGAQLTRRRCLACGHQPGDFVSCLVRLSANPVEFPGERLVRSVPNMILPT